jgi:hypothetical protein
MACSYYPLLRTLPSSAVFLHPLAGVPPRASDVRCVHAILPLAHPRASSRRSREKRTCIIMLHAPPCSPRCAGSRESANYKCRRHHTHLGCFHEKRKSSSPAACVQRKGGEKDVETKATTRRASRCMCMYVRAYGVLASVYGWEAIDTDGERGNEKESQSA